MASSSRENAYSVLGVDAADDDETIAAAYRHLARQFHPDVAGDDATRRMMRINAAFDRLRSPERRSAYDVELAETEPEVIANAERRRRAQGKPSSAGSSEDAGGTGTRPASAGAPSYERHVERDGTGGAGPPPGRPSGSVLGFGRHIGWSIGEIARVDPGYLAWLEARREGGPYLAEIDATLRRVGWRSDAAPGADLKRSRFRRG